MHKDFSQELSPRNRNQNVPKYYEIQLHHNKSNNNLNILSFQPVDSIHSNNTNNNDEMMHSKQPENKDKNTNNLDVPRQNNGGVSSTRKRKSGLGHHHHHHHHNRSHMKYHHNHHGHHHSHMDNSNSKKVNINIDVQGQNQRGKRQESPEQKKERVEKAFKNRQEVFQDFVNGDQDIDKLFFCRNFPNLHQKQKEIEDEKNKEQQNYYAAFLKNEEQKQKQRRMTKLNKASLLKIGRRFTNLFLKSPHQELLSTLNKSLEETMTHNNSIEDHDIYDDQNQKNQEDDKIYNYVKNRQFQSYRHSKFLRDLREKQIQQQSQQSGNQQELTKEKSINERNQNISYINNIRSISPKKQIQTNPREKQQKDFYGALTKKSKSQYNIAQIKQAQSLNSPLKQRGSNPCLSFMTTNTSLKKQQVQKSTKKKNQQIHIEEGYYTPYKRQEKQLIRKSFTQHEKLNSHSKLKQQQTLSYNKLGSLNNFSIDTTQQDQNGASISQAIMEDDKGQKKQSKLVKEMLNGKFVKSYVNPKNEVVLKTEPYENYFNSNNLLDNQENLKGSYLIKNYFGNSSNVVQNSNNQNNFSNSNDGLYKNILANNNNNNNNNIPNQKNQVNSTSKGRKVHSQRVLKQPSLNSYKEDQVKQLNVPGLNLNSNTKKGNKKVTRNKLKKNMENRSFYNQIQKVQAITERNSVSNNVNGSMEQHSYLY